MRRHVSRLAATPIAVLLLATGTAICDAQTGYASERLGQALVTRMCAQCHAIEGRARSPNVNAPSFWTLDRRVDLDSLLDRLREGLTSGHRDMPTFRFTREEARAVLLYLRSIQAP